MITEKHTFRSADLIAGNVALDFINTVTARDTSPRDWLVSYQSLIDWARFSSEFKKNDLDALSLVAEQDPAGAKAALTRATRYRELLCRFVYALLGKGASRKEDRSEIERAFQVAMNSVCFEWGAVGCRLTWTAERSGLDLIVHIASVQAFHMLAHIDIDRLRICSGENCGWVFLDTSRNGRRRWCDMSTCGNVAKARRYYGRTRKA